MNLVFGDKSHPNKLEVEFDRNVFEEFDRHRKILLPLRSGQQEILERINLRAISAAPETGDIIE